MGSPGPEGQQVIVVSYLIAKDRKVFSYFKRRKQDRETVAILYDSIVTEARREVYFTELEVPDTVDGRFDMLAAMVHLVLRQYRGKGQDTAGQALFDILFHDMDQSLREMGAGDLGVAPRVKNMAKAFYGRIKAYDEGLDMPDGQPILAEALSRNLYRLTEPTPEVVQAMAARMRAIDQFLAQQDPAVIASGTVTFPVYETQPAKQSS